jgi:hypothetical protein
MGKPLALNLSLSAIAVVFGVFAATVPTRAAELWGWRHLDKLAPPRRTLYLRCYRAFGIILCLAGVFFAIDSVTFSQSR